MIATKRKNLTTDDMTRREEPSRKRVRRHSFEDFSNNVNQNVHSDGYDEGLDTESDIEEMDGSDLDEEEFRRSGAESESADSNVDERLQNQDIEDQFTSSRFSFKPRSQLIQTTPSTSTQYLPTSFASLNVSTTLQTVLSKMSIRTPTEIQAGCIPPLLAGRDCIGNAKTGSGKTIAFALPILQKLSLDPYGIFALVLTPTRELAFQISEQFAVLGAPLNVRTAVVVGGMDMIAQALELGNQPHVVVATPGRIVDHLRSSSGEWNLSRVKFLVLDEADRLLTPTFAPELSYLFKVLPEERQTCLFTATWSHAVEKLAEAPPRIGKQKPLIHRISERVETVETLKQHYILVPSHVREAYLYHLLCNPPEFIAHLRRAAPEPIKPSRKGNKHKPKRSQKKATVTDEEEPPQPPPTIIFCNRPRTAAYLTHLLKTLSVRSTALHSRLTQRERLSSLSLFRSYVIPVLVSTDVGARGLDIEDVAMVVNWDMPIEPEEYIHRVGRTARAGRGGLAVSFVTERDEEKVFWLIDKR